MSGYNPPPALQHLWEKPIWSMCLFQQRDWSQCRKVATGFSSDVLNKERAVGHLASPSGTPLIIRHPAHTVFLLSKGFHLSSSAWNSKSIRICLSFQVWPIVLINWWVRWSRILQAFTVREEKWVQWKITETSVWQIRMEEAFEEVGWRGGEEKVPQFPWNVAFYKVRRACECPPSPRRGACGTNKLLQAPREARGQSLLLQPWLLHQGRKEKKGEKTHIFESESLWVFPGFWPEPYSNTFSNLPYHSRKLIRSWSFGSTMNGTFRDPGGAALLASPAPLPACVLRCWHGHLGTVSKPWGKQKGQGSLCFDLGRDITSKNISPREDPKRQFTKKKKKQRSNSTCNVGWLHYLPKRHKIRQHIIFAYQSTKHQEKEYTHYWGEFKEIQPFINHVILESRTALLVLFSKYKTLKSDTPVTQPSYLSRNYPRSLIKDVTNQGTNSHWMIAFCPILNPPHSRTEDGIYPSYQTVLHSVTSPVRKVLIFQ